MQGICCELQIAIRFLIWDYLQEKLMANIFKEYKTNFFVHSGPIFPIFFVKMELSSQFCSFFTKYNCAKVLKKLMSRFQTTQVYMDTWTRRNTSRNLQDSTGWSRGWKMQKVLFFLKLSKCLVEISKILKTVTIICTHK